MNVRRGDIVIVDYPYSDQIRTKYVQHLLSNRTSGTRGLTPRLLPVSQVVITGESELPRSILLISQVWMADKQGFALIPLFNVKIYSPTIETEFGI